MLANMQAVLTVIRLVFIPILSTDYKLRPSSMLCIDTVLLQRSHLEQAQTASQIQDPKSDFLFVPVLSVASSMHYPWLVVLCQCAVKPAGQREGSCGHSDALNLLDE